MVVRFYMSKWYLLRNWIVVFGLASPAVAVAFLAGWLRTDAAQITVLLVLNVAFAPYMTYQLYRFLFRPAVVAEQADVSWRFGDVRGHLVGSAIHDVSITAEGRWCTFRIVGMRADGRPVDDELQISLRPTDAAETQRALRQLLEIAR